MLGARRSRSSSISRGSINGTGLLLSVARGLSRLFHNADNLWMPKYTVRLVSWGGGDIDDRGITEFIDVSTLAVLAFLLKLNFLSPKLAISGIGTLLLDPCINTHTDAILQIKLVCLYKSSPLHFIVSICV